MRISPEIDNLNILNRRLGWIPSGDQIRPSQVVVDKKEQDSIKFDKFYYSIKDQILIRYFKFPSKINRNTSRIESKILLEKIREKRFLKNEYAYNVPCETNHYVMWYTYQDISDDNINLDIENSLYELLKHRYFEFVWYENPKMSVPDIYHVQVFWHLTNN